MPALAERLFMFSRMLWMLPLFWSQLLSAETLAIEIIEDMQFDVVVGGTKTVMVISPNESTFGAMLFKVTGTPNQKIKVKMQDKQGRLRSNRTADEIVISKFKFGCGLNKRGKVRLNSRGESGLLCIGAKAVVKANVDAGNFKANIPFVVDYL